MTHLQDICTYRIPWPGVISSMMIAIILAAVAFSSLITSNKPWIFSIVLVLGIFWTLIIYWVCMMGCHSIGWFLLLLPIGCYLIWLLSSFIASLTTEPTCVGKFPFPNFN